MYKNIGAKIKGLAKIICIVTAIVWIVFGFVLVLLEDSSTEVRLIGFLAMIVGPLFCWIAGFLLYGYGELIEQNCEINQELKLLTKRIKEQEEKETEEVILKQVIREKSKEEDEDDENASFYNPVR